MDKMQSCPTEGSIQDSGLANQLAEILFALAHEHGLHDTDGQEQGDQGTAAIADEGQREAGDRHEPDGHGDVDERLEPEEREDPHAEEPPGRVAVPQVGERRTGFQSVGC